MPSPLSSSGRASARPLQLADYPEGAPVGWDKAAYFGTVNFLDAQNDTFKVKLTGGATYDVFSTSTYDPHTLVVYDADGNAVAWDTNANALDFGEDSVLGFKATYTGDHYIAASWSFGINTVFGFIEVYEDADTIPPSTFVYGTAGDDVFRDGPSGQRFEGGPGRDAFEARDVGRRGATVQAQAGGDILVRHGDGQIDTLARIEEVRFADGRLVFDPSDPAAQVVRLYQAALGRAPDQGGLNAWTTALEAGAPLEDLARGFLGSAEFALRMGADLSDGAVVARLYQNVLRRAPDQGGYDYWTGALQHGTTRAQVLAGFSESAENKQNTAPMLANGIWDLSETAAQVARLYDTVFGRSPDIGGLASWRDAIESGGSSLQAVAGAFAASAEFQARYGALDDAGFATALYRNTLHREPDAPGLAGWTGAMARGAARSDVVLGFSESAEHRASTAQDIMSEDPASFGILFA
jgi:hypothetical protein